jgi:hypothetical protein
MGIQKKFGTGYIIDSKLIKAFFNGFRKKAGCRNSDYHWFTLLS